MVSYPRGAPVINPFTWITIKVDPAGGISNGQEVSRDHGSFRGDEAEASVPVLPKPQKSDRAWSNIKFDADAPTPLAVINP